MIEHIWFANYPSCYFMQKYLQEIDLAWVHAIQYQGWEENVATL